MSPLVVDNGGGGNQVIAGFRLAVREISPADGTQVFPSDRWTITTGTALANAPASKLQGDLISDHWSAYANRSSDSWIQAVSDAPATGTRQTGLIALLGINRRSPTTNISLIGIVRADGSTVTAGTLYTANTFRFRVDTHPLADRIRPACTVGSKTNLSGVNADFTSHPIHPPDDPAPPGYVETKLSPTNPAVATSIIYTFANHYATEGALAGMQTFRVHVRDVNNPLLIPLLAAVIYQSGSPVLTLVGPSYEHVEAASASGGFIFTYTFSASSLTSQTAAMEMHISASTACDFIGTELVLNIATGYDSGIETFTNIDLVSIAERLDYTSVIGAAATYYHIEPSDFCSYITATYSKVGGGTASANIYSPIVAPGDSDGRMRAGRLIIADTIIFAIQGTGGYQLTMASSDTGNSSSDRTRSGALRPPRVLVEWAEIDIVIIRPSRVLQQLIERQVRILGLMRTPTLLVPDPNMREGYWDEQVMPRWVVIAAKSESHQGRMTGIDDDSMADGMNHTRDHWDMNIHLIEVGGVRSGGR